jgi:hypothetical protein
MIFSSADSGAPRLALFETWGFSPVLPVPPVVKAFFSDGYSCPPSFIPCHPERSEGPRSLLPCHPGPERSEGERSRTVLLCHPERSEEPRSLLPCHPERSEGSRSLLLCHPERKGKGLVPSCFVILSAAKNLVLYYLVILSGVEGPLPHLHRPRRRKVFSVRP